MRTGDVIDVVDGTGGWYRSRLDEVKKDEVSGTIVSRKTDVGEPDYDLTIGLALLKKPVRFETFLEKAAEMGVRRVIPLITERTEKRHLRYSRSEHILIAAMKQCGRCRLVEMTEPMTFRSMLLEKKPEAAFICHEKNRPDEALTAMLPKITKGLTILVGPEGGFTTKEVAAAHAEGYRPVSLGVRRLRAETAAMVAATAVMLRYG